jgi:hypothetical protein
VLIRQPLGLLLYLDSAKEMIHPAFDLRRRVPVRGGVQAIGCTKLTGEEFELRL